MTENNQPQPEASAGASASVSFNVTMGAPLSPDPKENVFLVGTAHVSEKSIREVEEAIERYQPDVVAVELDDRRFKALQQPEAERKDIQIKELLKGNNLFVFMLQWLLAYVQRKVGVEAGVKPGAEMMAAIEVAKRKGMAVALIDRDIGITLNRVWNKMKLREKIRIGYSLVLAMLGFGTEEIDLDKITQEDVVEDLLGELKHYAPSMATVLVEERNAYLAHNLLEIGKTKRVLAVIGAGHREGIKEYMEHPEKIPPMASLMEMPQKKKKIGLLKIFSALVVLSVVAVFGLLLIGGISLQQLVLAVLILFLVQGVVSGLFVAVCGGHWKSIATAFALAWYGFLSPFIAIGWLAGVVEATQRPPTMEDLNTLLGKDDDSLLDTVRGMYHNRLFKAILIAAMANIGSMVGTFLGAYLLIKFFDLDALNVLQTGVSNGWNSVSGWLGALF